MSGEPISDDALRIIAEDGASDNPRDLTGLDPRVSAQDLAREVLALREAVRGLLKTEGDENHAAWTTIWGDASEGGAECEYCGATTSYDHGSKEPPIVHEEDCPVSVARSLLPASPRPARDE